MKVCEHCKDKKQCKDLSSMCLKLPSVLAASVTVMLVVLMFNSSL